ncbi:MAG: DNA polymerase III subunit beta [Bacteroidales bacterium]|nr:DNA polymerase III subunit beta [Bacteroidales bacterium]
MKFIVSSSTLLKNLQSVSGVLKTNNTLPILDDFLFDVQEDSLTVTASDLETTMTVRIPLEQSEETGQIAIPARILLETLKTLPDIPITFNINMESLGIEISAGEGNYKLSGHSHDEYPQKPELEDATSIKLKSDMLGRAITKTIIAAGNDDLRPVMSGVLCELSPEDIGFVATDAHKLVRYRRTDAAANEATSFILPKKPLNQLKNILPVSEEEDVNIEYTPTNASFSFENINLVCRLIDGKYPNYNAVIPQENPNKLVIERQPFLNAIRRVGIFANQSTHQIRLKISGQELYLSAEDIDYSNEAKERLNCNYEGEDMEIGFSSKFLVEMLNNIDTEEVRIEMSEPNRAGILYPVNDENQNEDILMLVMPVMLNQ